MSAFPTGFQNQLDRLSAFQRDLLLAIAETEGSKGVDIDEYLSAVYGKNRLNSGRLYPNLNKLVGAGMVAKAEVDGRTYSYTLTPEGESFVDYYRRWVTDG